MCMCIRIIANDRLFGTEKALQVKATDKYKYRQTRIRTLLKHQVKNKNRFEAFTLIIRTVLQHSS